MKTPTSLRIYGDGERAIFNDMATASGAEEVEIRINFEGPPSINFWGVTAEELEANEEFQRKKAHFEKTFHVECDIRTGWYGEFKEALMTLYRNEEPHIGYGY